MLWEAVSQEKYRGSPQNKFLASFPKFYDCAAVFVSRGYSPVWRAYWEYEKELAKDITKCKEPNL